MVKPRKDFDITIFQERLRYSPDTGIIYWKTDNGNGTQSNSRAGTVSSGYIKIKIDGIIYLGHRVAWALHYGVWPNHQIDHKDMDGTNNRINNLRAATNQENMRNRGPQKNNTTGAKGVAKCVGGYFARICVDGEIIYLGYFKTVEDASKAYRRAAKKFHGKFARSDHGNLPSGA